MSGMLYRLLGPDPELSDVLHDCFVRALGAIEQLREPEALDSWIIGVTVMTAKTHLQRRVRRSWLRLWPTDEPPELEFNDVEPEMREALQATYRILSNLSVEDRIVFVLRHTEQLTVAAIAEQLALSASTVKRRLARAEARFMSLSQREPAVESWIESWKPDEMDAPSRTRATEILDETRGKS
jgi:RNA polymerase sigma-70 factor (ECF subfamily)